MTQFEPMTQRWKELDEWLDANDTNEADDATAGLHGDLDDWLAANESIEGDKRRTQQCREPLNPAKKCHHKGSAKSCEGPQETNETRQKGCRKEKGSGEPPQHPC